MNQLSITDLLIFSKFQTTVA